MMIYDHRILAVVCAVLVTVAAQKCKRSQLECVVLETINDVDVLTSDFNSTTCPEGKCCWNSQARKCYDTNVEGKKDGGGERSLNLGPPKNEFGTVKELQEKVKSAVESEKNERSLGIFPSDPCKPPKQFPLNCVITKWTKYVFYPPLDVPYCVRIPCSQDRKRQMDYDKDLGKCGRQPGCYFDNELAEFRKWNVPIMPGVPVCHYAIRSAVFHREAKKVVDLMGEWNPYFTECIVEGEFKDEIEKGPPGCALNKLLELFHIPSKMAGWSTINRRQCGLIDACWFPRDGCFYPVDISNVIVKSGQKMNFNPREVVFGRPKCQHFDKSTPYDLLKSYHKCLIAGCTVDENIIGDYNMNLYKIGLSFSPIDHWNYWGMVLSGQIGGHNLDLIKWEKKSRGTPRITSCGIMTKGRGGRPCPPVAKTSITKIPHIYCPYKTTSFPKFTPLKGSTKGCCEVNECYLSRSAIRKMHSGPTKYLSVWTEWSQCSASCGRGKESRKRVCISFNKDKCDGPTKEVRPCIYNTCGTWGSWERWTRCGFCGVQKRERKCFGGTCDGESQESKPCPCWG